MHLFQYGSTEIDQLRKRDRILGKVIDGTGMIERPVTQGIFTALRDCCRPAGLGKGCGNRLEPDGKEGRYHNAGRLRCNNPEEIQQYGMAMRKAVYIRCITDAVSGIDLANLYSLSDGGEFARFATRSGVGIWTAEMLLIFSMERPDVVNMGRFCYPAGPDAAVRTVPETVFGVLGGVALSLGDFSPVRECKHSPGFPHCILTPVFSAGC